MKINANVIPTRHDILDKNGFDVRVHSPVGTFAFWTEDRAYADRIVAELASGRGFEKGYTDRAFDQAVKRARRG